MREREGEESVEKDLEVSGKNIRHGSTMKYLLRDGLEIGMPAGTRSNHSASLSLIPNQFISTSSQRGECR